LAIVTTEPLASLPSAKDVIRAERRGSRNVSRAIVRNTAGKRRRIVASSVRFEGGFAPRSEIQIGSGSGTTVSRARIGSTRDARI
jgi:hypothetical protein